MANLVLMQFWKYKPFYVSFIPIGHENKNFICLLIAESLTNHQDKARKYPSNKCKMQLKKII